MILENHQEFASPGEALAHYGTKGMKWGVRKQEENTKRERTPEEQARRNARIKKMLIGVGVLTAVAGAAFVAYKLNQSGKLPMSSIRKAAKPTPAVKKVIQEPTDIIHLTRGKTKGLRFQKQGGTPNHFEVWEKTLGKYAHSSERSIFERTGDFIAARFMDPEGRVDQSGRVIPHEVIIPKSMSAGVNSIEDVRAKIWPLLKDTYDNT